MRDSLHGRLADIKINILISMLVTPFFHLIWEKNVGIILTRYQNIKDYNIKWTRLKH